MRTAVVPTLVLLVLFVPSSSAPHGNTPPSGQGPAVGDGPVIVLKGEGDEEAAPHRRGNVYAPHVLVEGGLYRMWYGGQGRDGHDRILYAESRNGIGWERKGVAVQDLSANHVNDPSVVKIGDTYYMYFTRARKDVVDEIALATSSDGLRWETKGTVLRAGEEGEWDSLSVGRPSVLHEGGVFRMWYDGRKDMPLRAPAEGVPKSPTSTRSVGYATSKDGVRWTRHAGNPVFGADAGGVDVKRAGDRDVMLFESHEGTMAATSEDGTGDWHDHGVWLPKSGGEPDAHGHVTPFLLTGPGGAGAILYFGAAGAASWDRNAIATFPVPAARLGSLARRERSRRSPSS